MAMAQNGGGSRQLQASSSTSCAVTAVDHGLGLGASLTITVAGVVGWRQAGRLLLLVVVELEWGFDTLKASPLGR